jgi:hypothetical protein
VLLLLLLLLLLTISWMLRPLSLGWSKSTPASSSLAALLLGRNWPRNWLTVRQPGTARADQQ